jgi:hypothetical protein
MMTGMAREPIAAENRNDALAVADEDIRLEQENTHEVLPVKTVKTVTTKGKRRYIKMIVGGQSTGGLAKKVTLPVDG